jgi:hypothetical protein
MRDVSRAAAGVRMRRRVSLGLGVLVKAKRTSRRGSGFVDNYLFHAGRVVHERFRHKRSKATSEL